MALVDVDSWLTEYEACERLNHTILSQLAQRDKRQCLSAEYNRLTASIQVGLKQFDTELQQLKLKLDGSSKEKTITFEEIERRQRQLDTLQSQLRQLQTRFANSNRNDRVALLRQQGDGDAAPLVDSSDINALKQHQIRVLEEQNEGLETLSQTLSRQRALATQLGQEVDDQNDILDNLANTIERVESGVSCETNNIGQVNRRDSTWGYWIVIIVLFIAIVIVALF